jgi:serine/threonine protein kinase
MGNTLASRSDCDLESKFSNVDKLMKDLQGYECIRKLGSGGFGETYLFKNKNDKKIAVKALYEANDDVLNEVKVLKIIRKTCSNVLCHKKVLNYDKSSYIVTEFIDGVSLFDYYDDTRTNIKLTKICKYICQMIQALEYIHSIGVIHFDIKPENIIVKNSKLKLIDFGAAEYSPDFGKVTQRVYTKSYLPPGLNKDVVTFEEGVFRDYFAFLRTFRHDSKENVSPLERVLEIYPESKDIYDLFDTRDITIDNYKKRILKIKKVVCKLSQSAPGLAPIHMIRQI